MEYEGLLKPGLTDMSISEMRKLFVEEFDNNKKRSLLLDNFKGILDELSLFGIKFEVWVDGSFVTKKEEPSDIDICILLEENEVDNMMDFEKIQLKKLSQEREEIKLRKMCDIYFCVNDFRNRKKWLGTFGFDRNDNPKGIARIMVDADI